MKNIPNKIKTLVAVLTILFFSENLFAQVAINDDGSAPNSNTILDINFSGTNIKGLLIPRMTTTQRTGTFDDSFAGSENGLTVYDTDNNTFFYWNGSSWDELTKQGANWSVTGNSTISSTTNFLGTTDASDIVIRTNDVERARFLSDGKFGINTTSPDVYFHIFGDDGTTVGDDATYNSGTGLLVLGEIAKRNLVFDQNEIMARNNGSASSLYLQNRGGDIRIHYDRPVATHDDGSQVVIKDDGKVGIGFLYPEDMLHIYNDLPYMKFTDTDGGSKWRMGVNGASTRFQIGDYTGATFNSRRFVIKEGGNIGIGTVVPEGLLHLKADAGNSATFLIDADAGSGANDTWKLRSDATSHNLNFLNDVNVNVSFTSLGNVGIGTESPEGILHVSSNEGNNATFVIDADEGDDAADTWKIRSVAANNNLNFINDATTRMSIEATGNVGVGTDNPDAKLHVLYSGSVMSQYAGTVATFQQNNATTDWSRISIIAGNAGSSLIDFGDADKQDPGAIKYDHTNNAMSFFTDDTNERVRITSTGNVGIMVTDPDEVLEVNGAIHLGTTTNTNAGAIRWNGTNFQGYDGSSWKALDVQAVGGAGGWSDGGTDVYLTTTSDNVGIGTNTPNEKLEVNGSIRMTDGNEGANKVMVSDANGTASWSNENDGVKTRVIRQINGGASTRVTLWSHPEGIDVEFDPSTERVYVTNNTGDATHYWDIAIEGDARTGSGSTGSDQYIKHYRKDGEALYLDLGTIDSGWFTIIASDQNNQKDGFIINVVYYGDDLNGTVQYWDN